MSIDPKSPLSALLRGDQGVFKGGSLIIDFTHTLITGQGVSEIEINVKLAFRYS